MKLPQPLQMSSRCHRVNIGWRLAFQEEEHTRNVKSKNEKCVEKRDVFSTVNGCTSTAGEVEFERVEFGRVEFERVVFIFILIFLLYKVVH